jgi:dTDP-4-dehydrorhamnose 3,5-epimerase
MDMKINPLEIPGVLEIMPPVFQDERGFFLETYQREKFSRAGIIGDFVQDNHSRSKCGSLRGLHYQIDHSQGKLIRVVTGQIYDVAVDLRRSSSTFGKWVGIFLSAQEQKMLWLPPGFAHGFYTLSEWADVIYKTTDFYSPADERTILWNDPTLAIAWPLSPDQAPLLSQKDLRGCLFENAEVYQ